MPLFNGQNYLYLICIIRLWGIQDVMQTEGFQISPKKPVPRRELGPSLLDIVVPPIICKTYEGFDYWPRLIDMKLKLKSTKNRYYKHAGEGAFFQINENKTKTKTITNGSDRQHH